MMRRGPLGDRSIRSLLEEAAEERLTAVIELHSDVEGLIYLVDGEVYLVDFADEAPLQTRLARAGLLTVAQIERHTEPGDEEAYLSLALDTDETIDEQAIGAWLLDHTAHALHHFEAARQGEYEVDPYGAHPAGILASWQVAMLYDRVDQLATEAAEGPAAGDELAGTDEAAAAHDEPERSTLPPPPVMQAPPNPMVQTSDTTPDGLAIVELSPLEWRVVILAAHPLPQNELAARLELDEVTTGGLVDALCERGLVNKMS